METFEEINSEMLNAALEAFEITVKQEPMLSQTAKFARFIFEENKCEINNVNMSLFMNGFSYGFCYSMTLLKENKMSIHCLEIDR